MYMLRNTHSVGEGGRWVKPSGALSYLQVATICSIDQLEHCKLSKGQDKLVCVYTYAVSTYPSFVVSATAAMSCTVLGLWWIWVCSPRYFWTKSFGVMNFSPSLSTTLAYWEGGRQQKFSQISQFSGGDQRTKGVSQFRLHTTPATH